jgi:hypothetical protein
MHNHLRKIKQIANSLGANEMRYDNELIFALT